MDRRPDDHVRLGVCPRGCGGCVSVTDKNPDGTPNQHSPPSLLPSLALRTCHLHASLFVIDGSVCFIIIFKGIPVKEIVKHRNYILLSLSLSLFPFTVMRHMSNSPTPPSPLRSLSGMHL